MMLGIPNFQPALGYTPENVANKQTTLSASATGYPNADAVIAAISDIPTFDPASNQTITGAWGFTDSLTKNSVEVATVDDVANAVLGLFDDRGTYNASSNTFPATGGSGASGAILKGDVWTVSVAGTLGGAAVTAGDTVRALTDTPGQTASNWAIAETNIGYVPEPAIASGTTAQYWRGDKTWRDFFTDVRAATLTGLSLASSAAITATSTTLESLGQLQAQVSLRALISDMATYVKTALSATGDAGIFAIRAAVEYDAVNYTNPTGSYIRTGSTVVCTTDQPHTFKAGHKFWFDRQTGGATDELAIVTSVPDVNTIIFEHSTPGSASGTFLYSICNIWSSNNVSNVAYYSAGLQFVNITDSLPNDDFRVGITNNFPTVIPCYTDKTANTVSIVNQIYNGVEYAPTRVSIIIA